MKNIFLIAILTIIILGSSMESKAEQGSYNIIKESIPSEISSINNFGTEFLFSVPPCLQDEGGSSDNKIIVYATSFTRSNITLTGKNGFIQKRELKPFQTTEIVLPPIIAQPYLKSGREPSVPDNLYSNSAVKIVSDEPISVYVLIRYNKTSDGFIAFPVETFGRKYIVSSYNDATDDYPGLYSLPSIATIVAAYDNTTVNFRLGGNSITTTASITGSNDSINIFMNKGDVFVVSSLGNNSDLSGSIISANLPIAVLSGNQCANIPANNQFCDYIVTMEPPLSTWGKSYYVPIIKGRKKSPILRIYASEPNTKVFLNGEQIFELESAGGKIGKGYEEYRINSTGNSQIGVITADKPIAVTLLNTGVAEDGFPEPLGAPFHIPLIPAEQELSEVLFTTRGINTSSQYFESYISINIDYTADGKLPNDLELGTFDGLKFNWVKVNSINPTINRIYSFGEQGHKRGNFTFPFFVEGVFKLRSSMPFSAYFYGMTSSEAFGFPLNFGLKTLNEFDTEKPRINSIMDCMGDVIGWALDMPDDDAFRSNLALPIFYSDSSFNYDKEFGKIVPGISRNIEWRLKVRDRSKPARGVILFRDMAGNDTLVVMEYHPLQLTIIPNSFDFGSLKSGESIEKEFEIRNDSKKAIDIKRIKFSQNLINYEFIEPLPYGLIQPDEILKFKIRFTAAENGIYSDSVGIGDDCQFHWRLFVIARVGNPEILADDITFNDVTIHKQQVRTFKVHNKGKANLIIHSISGPFTEHYKLLYDNEISVFNPMVIPPGSVYEFQLEFEPKAEGIIADSIIFHSDAVIIDSVTIISGRGIKQGIFAESYNWGRKRINRSDFPTQKYSVENSQNGIVIQNIGTAPIIIKDYKISGDEESKKAFDINLSPIVFKQFNPGDKMILPAFYHPNSIGQHIIEVTLFDNSDYYVNFVLSGIGTAPDYSVNNINFDTTIVGARANYSIRAITIENKSLSNWEYGDTLTIYSISSIPENAVSINSGFGENGFRINLNNLTFPVKLAPSEFITFFGYFSAVIPNENIANLSISSDALLDKEKVLSGFGLETELSIHTEEYNACPYDDVVIRVQFKNNGSSTIEIGKLMLSSINSDFSFVNDNDKNGFDIIKGETKYVDLYINPKTIGLFSDYLVIYDKANNAIDSVGLLVRSQVTQRSLILNPIQQTAIIGQEAPIRLSLSDGQDISYADIREIDVKLTFDNSFLSPNLQSIALGANLQGLFIINNLNYNQRNEITFKLRSIAGANLNIGTELIRMKFNVIIPNNNITSSVVSADININSTTCVKFIKTSARVNLNPVCASDIRKVNISNTNYTLSQPNPNPVRGALSISFSIGLSGYTDLTIFNSSGEEILKPIAQEMDKGEYILTIPTDELSSGIYYYRLTSGPFSETKKLVVVK